MSSRVGACVLACLQLKGSFQLQGLPPIPSTLLSNRLSQALLPLGLTLSGLTAKVGRPSFRRLAARHSRMHGGSSAVATDDEEDDDEEVEAPEEGHELVEGCAGDVSV